MSTDPADETYFTYASAGKGRESASFTYSGPQAEHATSPYKVCTALTVTHPHDMCEAGKGLEPGTASSTVDTPFGTITEEVCVHCGTPVSHRWSEDVDLLFPRHGEHLEKTDGTIETTEELERRLVGGSCGMYGRCSGAPSDLPMSTVCYTNGTMTNGV